MSQLLRRLFRRSSISRDIQEEIDAHLAMRTDLNRAAGMPDDEAVGAARLRLGDEARGRPLVEEALARDPRLGYGEPHLRLGDYYLEHGQPAEALVHLERFAEVHASSVEGQYKLARVNVTVGADGVVRGPNGGFAGSSLTPAEGVSRVAAYLGIGPDAARSYWMDSAKAFGLVRGG